VCAAAGESNILSWEETTQAVRESTMAGVKYHLDNPDVTPEQSHESWMKHRAATGWVYGEVKDLEKKIHPNLVAYEQLPLAQQMKDHVFRAAVHALKSLPLEQIPAAAPAAPQVVAAKGFVPVQYVGARETYKEGLYGSGLVFTRGQVLPVPAAIAVKLLAHPDVYRPGKLEEDAPSETAAETKTAQQTEEDREEEQLHDYRDSIGRMTTKKAVAEFANTNFRVDLDQRKSLADLRAEAIQLIDRYGMPK
jgi:hypothetical protein